MLDSLKDNKEFHMGGKIKFKMEPEWDMRRERGMPQKGEHTAVQCSTGMFPKI